MLKTNESTSTTLSILTALSLGLIIFGVRVHFIDGFAVAMPYWDDWGFASFLQDYQNGKLTFADFLVPINEHRMFFNRLISVAVFELNHQQWDPVVMMLINAGIWTLSGVLLLYITIKHQRQFNALPLILIILMICLYPVSPVNALWGVQTHNYMMILLAVSACWFINQPVLSAQWWLGLSF